MARRDRAIDMRKIILALAIVPLIAGCTEPAKRFLVDLGPRYECSKGERRIDPAFAALVKRGLGVIPQSTIGLGDDEDEDSPSPEVPQSVIDFLRECGAFLEDMPSTLRDGP